MPYGTLFSNSDDVIDSRQVIERIAELEMEIEDAEQHAKATVTRSAEDSDRWCHDGDTDTLYRTEAEALTAALAEVDVDDEREELKALKALADEGEQYAEDWRHGATLVRESYFVDYCYDLVRDIGDMPNEIPGYIVIDWEATADNIKADYTEVDFDGVTYLVR